eukprot:CAMPEP_0194373876 /NCGR_PEP_ID=MMETSP0174-20130528/22280_1 /TAXON_ID=216777 /ORGANISM="Proboscia alata, Strain PI-D3" /LENGTH=312 /DNA_ID=CAMNT_0039153155 /DNA_START=128 /DNA_END=1066 /DNA_ORIENTATION=-
MAFNAPQESSYAQASLYLSITKALIVPATQPLQVVMRAQQTALSKSAPMSALNTYKSIARNAQGPLMKSMFRGTAAAMTKEAIKNGTYKAVLFKGAPKLVSKYLSSPTTKSMGSVSQHLSIAFVGANIAAFADTLLGGPFERYATYRVTSQGASENASFLAELKTRGSIQQQAKFVYKGSTALYLKTGIACFTLFAAAKPAQSFINSSIGLKPGDEIPLAASGITAFVTGAAVAVASSPFDIVKTIHQMPNTGGESSTMAVLKTNYTKFGLKGLSAGLPIKTVMVIIGWGAVSAITQQSSTVPEYGQALFRY